MKIIIITLLLLVVINLNSQTELTFDKRFVECEDKWIAFQMDEDSTHSYGFIYIDEEAGLTFNLEGKFKHDDDSSYIIEKHKDKNIIMRLEPNNIKVAIIPETMFNSLQIDTIPEWLTFYKNDLNSVSRLYKWGYFYNAYNECEKALEFLLEAKGIDIQYEGLAVEIVYSYNCLEEYDKAIEVLDIVLTKNSKDPYVNKEYIYTLVRKGSIDKAIEQFYKSIKNNIKNTYNAENSFNILGHFYYKNDKKNFNIWKLELEKWPNSNEKITQYVKMMEKELE